MIFLNILERIFHFLFPISIIISLIVETTRIFSVSSEHSDKDTASNNTKKLYNWKNNVRTAITISTAVIFIFVILLIAIKVKNLYWLIILISIPFSLEQLIVTYQSIGIVKKVIKSNDNNKLSSKEWAAINILAYTIWFLKIQNIFEKIIEKIIQIKNVYLSDIFLVLTYTLIFSIYIFLICSLLLELLVTALEIIKKLLHKLPWNTQIKHFEDYWIHKIGKTAPPKSTLVFQWEHLEKQNQFIRWLRYFLLPFTFILDVIIEIISVLFYGIGSAIGYICILLKMIKETLNRFSTWLLKLSDKKIISISFRIAFIMALVCIVSLNRYQSIFKIQESSTAVLEFIASAIIIPIIFEWINSFKTNHVNSNKDL